MEPDEILTAVAVDVPPPFTGSEYLKLGHRNALEIAIVAVAVRITLDKPDGVIKEARIVLSAVAPTAIRAPKAEGALVGEKPSETLFARAGEVAGTECSPISDIRGGAEYRCAMVETLTRRALSSAARTLTT
jgi:carbon-monoxide dehydrogenase medium subunit